MEQKPPSATDLKEKDKEKEEGNESNDSGSTREEVKALNEAFKPMVTKEDAAKSALKSTDVQINSKDEKDDEEKEKEEETRSDQPSSSRGTRKTILEEHGIITGRVIGSGSYAKVRIAFSEVTRKPVAVKIISKTKAPDTYKEKFLPRELDAVKGLHHENLIRFYQSIETSHSVYIVMQLAENGTLLDYIRSQRFLEEAVARKLFGQLISAIGYCHSKGVVHRDIKCENLLLDSQYNLKLIDFGFSRKGMLTADNKAILSSTYCGSYAYASPEVLKGDPYDAFMSDIWSTGIVLYAMCFGRLPFDGPANEMLRKVTGKLHFPKSPVASNNCRFLITHIIAPLRQRYRIPQIKEDPWFLSTLE